MAASPPQPPRLHAARINASLLWRAALLLLGVLLVHAVALHWVGGELQSIGFKPLAQPIYTRLITPASPPPAPVAATATPAIPPAPRRVARAVPWPAHEMQAAPPVVAQVAVPTPQPPASAAQETAPAAQETAPAAQAAASAPQATASAPLAAASALATADARAAAWPPSTKIFYTLGGNYRGALHGTASFEWLRSGDDYQLFLRMHSLITQEYRSRGRVAGGWLQPARYEEQGVRGVTAVNFNRDADTLSFSSVTDVLPLPAHVQDTASTIMQLAGMLATQPALFSDGASVPMQVARPRGLDRWEFEVVGYEQLQTGQGPLWAWHVRRVPRKTRGDIGVDLWLSPQLQSLPVRIRLTQAEDVYLDLLLDKAEQG